MKVVVAALAAALPLMSSAANAHCIGYVWIFTQPRCGWCDATRDLFARNGVYFASPDVTWFAKEFNNRRYSDWMLKNYGTIGTPIIVIDGVVIDGYDETKIRKEACLTQ